MRKWFKAIYYFIRYGTPLIADDCTWHTIHCAWIAARLLVIVKGKPK